MNYSFEFDEEKSIEVILYIASKCNNLYNLLKILYFADKKHLQEYGRFICGDNYVLLPHGPVPSKIYDIIKDVRDNRKYPIPVHLKNAFTIEGKFIIKPLREPSLEYFSRSDIECLDETIEKYGNMDFQELKELTHKEPDVMEVEKSYDENIYIEIIAKYFEKGTLVLEYLNC